MALTFLPYAKIVKKPSLKPYNANPQTLGEHIKKRRIETNLLQKEVAAIIGVSEDSVTYWENGRAIPQVQHYPRLITFLGYYPFIHETKSIAGKLKQVRNCLGLSYEQCGEVFSVHASTIRAWELKHHCPPAVTHLLITALWDSLPEFVTI
ncbi:helix-turn-helix transcriptional regulator [Mucilaginibacter sp.]|uniref:helix-turn-helix transcriptional regulator n=1 Tax=Mucilaginibacter sp. TaxID=1882438 RepID=UPI00260A367D|nr:helix-turn-helix transcriptional regulator [Mucilaginibacter sp.]